MLILRLFWCEHCENLKGLTTERVKYLQEHFGKIDCRHYKSTSVNCEGILKEVTIGFMNTLAVKDD